MRRQPNCNTMIQQLSRMRIYHVLVWGNKAGVEQIKRSSSGTTENREGTKWFIRNATKFDTRGSSLATRAQILIAPVFFNVRHPLAKRFDAVTVNNNTTFLLKACDQRDINLLCTAIKQPALFERLISQELSRFQVIITSHLQIHQRNTAAHCSVHSLY